MQTDITASDMLEAVAWARRFINHPDSQGHRMGVKAFFHDHKLGAYMAALAALEGKLADEAEKERHGED